MVTLISSIKVRLARSRDIDALLKMPPYLRGKSNFLLGTEGVLVVESNGVICGAVTVSRKDISLVHGEWKEDFKPHQENLVHLDSKGWISRLYVFPEYRNQDMGTKLVEEAVSFLKKKKFTEAYAGIYIRNESRDISHRVFEKAGFEKMGSCVCLLVNGYCRGTLFMKAITSN